MKCLVKNHYEHEHFHTLTHENVQNYGKSNKSHVKH